MSSLTIPALPAVTRSIRVAEPDGTMSPELWRLLEAFRQRLDPPRDLDSASGWLTAPGGVLLQWGEATAALDNIAGGVLFSDAEAVTFPIAYAEAPPVVLLQVKRETGKPQATAQAGDITTAGFDAFAQRPAQAGEDETTGESITVMWHAFGRAI